MGLIPGNGVVTYITRILLFLCFLSTSVASFDWNTLARLCSEPESRLIERCNHYCLHSTVAAFGFLTCLTDLWINLCNKDRNIRKRKQECFVANCTLIPPKFLIEFFNIIYIYIHTHTHTHTYIYVCVCVCVCGCLCVCVCVFVCVYLCKIKHRHVKLSKIRRALSANLCFTLYYRNTFEGLEAEPFP